ncbi:MAG TPA: DUF5979 domain-containing protein [Acidimicrobiales bacterium]|nr:DUF5979 domain-containing protein [Acidimicrobiales bacterium]
MAWALVAAGLTYVGGAAVTTSDRVTPANFSGYATGTGIHAHLLRATTGGSGSGPGTEVLDVDEAFSAASVNTAGLQSTLANEVGVLIHPDGSLAGKKASGRGSGVELGIATDVPVSDANRALILSNLAKATAPPDTGVIQEDLLGPLQIDPVLFASAAHGEAQAQIGNLFDRCPSVPLADPFGMGEGHLAQAQLLNGGPAALPSLPFVDALLGTDSPTPQNERAAFTRSITYPIANGDGTFGIVSEVHSTVAPITISTAPGPLDDITIRVIGEAVMKVTATGKPDNPATATNEGAKVEYTPPPVVSVQTIDAVTHLPVIQEIIPAIPIPILPILSTFEDARKIGSEDAPLPPEDAADGTLAAAAADVVRVRLPGGLLDLRLLHVEARAQVPAGGFSFNDCGQLKVTKHVVGGATGPFTFNVVCNNFALDPSESTFTLADGQSKTISIPTGTVCLVTEPGKGTANRTTIAESPPGPNLGHSDSDGAVVIPAALGVVNVDVTNFAEGNLKVIKSAQSTLSGPFGFSAICVPATAAVPGTFTLGPNDSKTFGPIPAGTECTVAETDRGGAAVTRVSDSTAPAEDGKVGIVGGGTSTVSFSNAGPPVIISKVTAGDAAAGKGPFKFHLECKDPSGAVIALSAADTDFTLAAGADHRINTDMPDGSTCIASEVDAGGATTTVPIDTSGADGDRTVITKHGETHVVTFTNTFIAQVKLIITKTVVGTGTGPFAFHVSCTGFTLPAADADFTLAAGGTKSIKAIPDGSTCTVTEPDSKGATKAFSDTSGTTTDGVVLIPAGNASTTVAVTNTFVPAPTPPNAVAPIVIQPRTVG